MLKRGGNGGFGNYRFRTSTNQAPQQANPGLLGEEGWIGLQLKVIADVGLLGLPNAGKSTLLARISAARPKIADYPFTTLYPELGVVRHAEDAFVVADIPGLIKDAHQGAGLGHRFLGHIERCVQLLHLIDVTADDPLADLEVVRKEVRLYAKSLAKRPITYALSKSDALPPAEAKEKCEQLAKAIGEDVHLLSSHTGDGLKALIHQLGQAVMASQSAKDQGRAKTWDPLSPQGESR